MPRYRVAEKSFIDNALREEGEIVDYAGSAGKNLELVEGEAPAQKPDPQGDLSRQHAAAWAGDANEPGILPPSRVEAAEQANVIAQAIIQANAPQTPPAADNTELA